MSTKPIIAFAKWQVKENHLDEVLTLLEEVVPKSRKEPGNLFYQIYKSTSNPNTIVLYEGYIDEAAVEEHRNTPHFQKVIIEKIIPLLENREVTLTTSISL